MDFKASIIYNNKSDNDRGISRNIQLCLHGFFYMPREKLYFI